MRKSLAILLIVILFFCFLQSSAQSVIDGTIIERSGSPIQNASVLLLKASDSSLQKGMISDFKGSFSFKDIPQGIYLINASYAGMKSTFSEKFEIGSGKKVIRLDTIYLAKEDVQLNTVTVISKKPLFEQKVDRLVINVKNSITDAGGTALDVLSKSPGVTVNRQNNSIAVNGKSGVVVMINGRITYMPVDALVQLLGGINASNIEKIEVITTPPSKYDAEGNAGYINIVLVNNPYYGANGSYFISAGYGKRELGSAGLNFNYRNSKMNIYGDYSFDYNHSLQGGSGFNQWTKSGNIITTNSFSNRDAKRNVHNVRLGLDYQLDSSDIIGALVSGYNNQWKMIANNGAGVEINNLLDTTIVTVDNEINHWQNVMGNLNYQHTFKPGNVLYIDANYIYYKDNNPNTYNNEFYKGKNYFLYDENIRSGKLTPINMRVFSADYTGALSKKAKMEAGAKVSFSKFTNNVSIENLVQGTWMTDPSLSADYLLKENIAAAYSSFNIDVNDKTSIKAGLRFEYTYSNLGTTQQINIVDRKYGELFPTFYISHKLNETNSINFSYSRRITRPTFNDLAPFTIFFDPKTFFTGNPALQPAIISSVQASYILKNYIFSLNYGYETNSIESFQTQRVDTVSNIVYLSAKNFKYEQYLTASFSLPFNINKWWSMQNNINFSWRQVNTTYNNDLVQLAVASYNLNSTQRFSFPKDISLELTAFYSSAAYFGTNKLKPIYQVDMGLQKKLKNKKDILRFTANDMFGTGSNFRYVEDLPIQGTTMKGSLNFGTIAYKIIFTHNFGNKALKNRRERSTGAEDELNRVRSN
jgi:outer membrane receptor protein involved in Fe transport